MTAVASDLGFQHSDTASQPQAFSLQTPTLNAGAMTLTLNPANFAFRNPTLTNGGVTTVAQATALAITIPSGATLGSINATTARYAIGVAYNGGSPVAIVGNVNGLPTDTSQLISPTTISAGATSAGVWYSASAVSANSPFIITGFIDSTQATAGTYATAPNVILGDVAHLGATNSLGFSQSWQSVTRVIGTTYYNTTGRPILAMVNTGSVSNAAISFTVNGQSLPGFAIGSSVVSNVAQLAFIPVGASYSASGSSLGSWYELR